MKRKSLGEHIPKLKSQKEALHELFLKSEGRPLTKEEENYWNESLPKFRPICERHHGLETALGAVYWIKAPFEEKIQIEEWFKRQPWYEQLTCKPHKNSLAPGQPKTFSVSYVHASKIQWIGIPRFLGLSIFGIPQKDIRKEGLEIHLEFKMDRPLREYQETATQAALKSLKEWGGATIIADCGAGKTAMALKIASLIQRKTLVLCNRSFLMEQWRHDIEGKLWTWADDNSTSEAQENAWKMKCANCKKNHVNIQPEKQELPSKCTECGFLYASSWIGCTEPREGWLSDVKCGKLQGAYTENKISKKIIVDGMDIVIGSIESLSQCEYPKQMLEQFGLIIVDEMHHLGALTLSQVLPKLPAKYILGITATPDRNDGLEHVLYWLAGPTCFVYKRLPSVTGQSNTVKVNQMQFAGGKREEIYVRGGQLGFAAMISSLAQDEVRNTYLLSLTKELLKKRKKILIVTSIVDHAKALGASLENSIVIHGGCSSAKVALAKSGDQQCVIATYQFLEEGYDDPLIDTLIMALPRSKIQQVVGRCERTHEGKLVPLVIDIVDTFSVFMGMSWKRHAFYKSRGFDTERLNC